MKTQNTVSKKSFTMKKKNSKSEVAIPAPLVPVNIAAKAINKIAMLFSLTVRCFIGNPMDKDLTAEVTTTHGVSGQKRLSVRKRIMQGEELNAVINAAQKLRITHAAISRPWFDGGVRVIPSVSFMETSQKMGTLRDAFDAAVDKFIANYDLILQRDKQELNGTFDISDYPQRAELKAKFAADFKFLPIPTNSDFRVDGLSDETMNKLRADMEKDIAEKMRAGDCELLQRLKDEVSHLLTRLTVKNASGNYGFKKNSLENIKTVALEVAALNIGENDKISSLCNELETAFDMDADLLREDDAKREEKAKEAKAKLAEIEKAMAGLM